MKNELLVGLLCVENAARLKNSNLAGNVIASEMQHHRPALIWRPTRISADVTSSDDVASSASTGGSSLAHVDYYDCSLGIMTVG